MQPRRVAGPLAAVLTLALVAPASAATTAQISESFTVTSTLGITLSTAAINYGDVELGAASTHVPIDITVTANGNWSLGMSGGNFVNQQNNTSLLNVRWARVTAGPPQSSTQPFPVGTNSFVAQGSASGVVSVEQWIDLTGNTSATVGTYTGTTMYGISQL